MKRLAIIHTTTATVEMFKALASELMPEVEVINFVDDSILPQLARNGGDIDAVCHRLVKYAQFAYEVGADVILEACSSVGEIVSDMQQEAPIPVIRIDKAMAEVAVNRGNKIGVAATLPTTLNPTTRLVLAQARASGAQVSVQPLLVQGAYNKLMAGDKDGHDNLVAQALTELAATCDVVVLAQASMARVLDRLPEEQRGRFLTSPRLAMERVKSVLASSTLAMATD